MKEENWTIEYTYPQLPIQTATTRPGSILNRQGGSIFNRREHVLVEMNAATDVEYLPLARRIAADENVVLSDAQLLAAIAGNNGSFRSVIFSVLRLALRTARQSASAASIAAATIQQAAKGSGK
jgi:hypothetical protein